MDVKECYELIGGDYSDAIERMVDEDLIRNFLIRFTNDETYPKLERSIKSTKIDDVFPVAHTLKGLCQNLCLGNLGHAISVLTEALRNGKLDLAKELMPQVTEEYNKTVEVIKQLQ